MDPQNNQTPSKPSPQQPQSSQPTPAETIPPQTKPGQSTTETAPTMQPQGSDLSGQVSPAEGTAAPIESPNQPPTNQADSTKKPKSKKGLLVVVILILVLVLAVIFTIVFYMIISRNRAVAPTSTTSNSSSSTSSSSSSTTKKTAPGSLADEQLTADILKAIYTSESVKADITSNEIVVTNVKLISNEGNKKIVEEWSIDIGGVTSVYTVTIIPTPDGGADYAVLKKS